MATKGDNMFINQLSVFIENKTGKLVDAIELLADANIDICALSIADTEDYGILRLIVDDVNKAKSVLEENNWLVKITPVIGVSVRNNPGCFAKVVRILADNDINLEYTYAFIANEKHHHHAYVVLRVEDNEKASQILKDNGVKLISEDFFRE